MLATSHKPFAFKILLVNLYFPKILAVFTAQIFDSTRPGGYPFKSALRAGELSSPKYRQGESKSADEIRRALLGRTGGSPVPTWVAEATSWRLQRAHVG